MKIVVTEPYLMADSVRRLVDQLGSVIYGPFDDQEFAQTLKNCNILIIRLGRYIGEDIFRCAPNLKYIVSATTGLDHVDVNQAKASCVQIISLQDCMEKISGVSATAEHTWGLLLALIRRTTSAANHVLGGGWDRNLFWGSQLRGKTLGIIGLGRIGGMVARYGAAFGMKVLAHEKDPRRVINAARLVSLDSVVRESDVISVHASANNLNYHLVDREMVNKFKRGAYFLNTSRGMLVDSSALAQSIISGQLAGVAVDVLEGEAHNVATNDPLLECAIAGFNVLITPHISGATRESIEMAERAVVEHLTHIIFNKICA
jgi:D-3-phosphoglycerate dehydrogenase